jgi:ubiquinone biosynthesis protein UbiJ
LRILRSQLERYIAEQFGSQRVASAVTQTELRKLNKEIAGLKKKLAALELRKAEIEKESGQ